MMSNRITAVFDSREHAQMAIDELRAIGVGDAHLSFLSRHEERPLGGGGGLAVADRDVKAAKAEDMGAGVGKGLVGGAAVGALFGLAAALIPGVGPFIAAGTLASALGATGGAVAAGAIVGGTSGAIAGALSKAGYTREESEFYGRELEQGRVVVAVEDTGGLVDRGRIQEILRRHGGRTHAGWAV